VITVDVIARQNWETLYRLMRTDTRGCGACHERSMKSFVSRKANFDGLDTNLLRTTSHTTLTWDFVKRLRDTVKTRLLVKGLMTAEDARLAVERGLDGIVVSNHGGRAEDHGRSTIDALPEIVDAVGGRIPVIVDSGFRRGTDIVKALAMGAQAVGIGRPYLWGLGAFGEPGVERVLGILREELRSVMMQIGAPSLKDIVPAMVRRA
jgi:4-hydroxymandelate oxidase